LIRSKKLNDLESVFVEFKGKVLAGWIHADRFSLSAVRDGSEIKFPILKHYFLNNLSKLSADVRRFVL
jgi:hypothetical protein